MFTQSNSLLTGAKADVAISRQASQAFWQIAISDLQIAAPSVQSPISEIDTTA